MGFVDLIGTPFVGKGRNIKVGFDCYGLVQEVYKRFGYTIPEYYDAWDDSEQCNAFYHDGIKTLWEEVKDISNLQPPLLIAFSFGNVKHGVVNHSGVYIGNGKFIHTRAKVGCCIERIDSPAWHRLIVGYYRYKGQSNDNTN